MRKESTPNVELTNRGFHNVRSHDDLLTHKRRRSFERKTFTERKLASRKDAESAHDSPSESSSMEIHSIHEPLHGRSATH